MIYSTTLDAAFRVTLELSFGQTGRHCHLLEESAVWENKKRVNHRGGNWPNSLSIPGCLAHVRALVGKKEVCRDPGRVLIETFRGLSIVGPGGSTAVQFDLGVPVPYA